MGGDYQHGPLLQGQTQAAAQHDGYMVISDMLLNAEPGLYILIVTLPDYLQVTHFACLLMSVVH